MLSVTFGFVRAIYILLVLLGLSFYSFAQDSLLADSLTVDQRDTSENEQMAGTPINQLKDLGDVRSTSGGTPLFFIGLASFLFFGLLRFFYARHLDDLVNVLSKSTLGRMTSKDSLWRNQLARVMFTILYYISCGFLLGQFIKFFTGLQQSELMFWIWGVGAVIGLFILKRVSIHAVALIFKLSGTATTFFKHISVVNQLLGFILLPVGGAMLLLPAKISIILLFIGGIIVVISLIYKALINMAYVRNMSGVSFLHFIIYLCAFEIIPLAVCVRYVHNTIGA